MFCLGGFWQGGFLSRGFLSGGLCPGGFCPGGFCPRTIFSTLWSFWSVTTAKEAEHATGHEGFWQPFYGESKTRSQWHLLGCGMQLICNDENEYNYFVYLNHNVNERGNLCPLSTNYELSRRENNLKLPELSVTSGCHILRTSHYDRLQETQNSREGPMNK